MKVVVGGVLHVTNLPLSKASSDRLLNPPVMFVLMINRGYQYWSKISLKVSWILYASSGPTFMQPLTNFVHIN
jgi:hypothetical protein